MLSGVGPKKHLASVGIKSIQNLPVGLNLMDHIAFGGLIFKVNQPVSIVRNDLLHLEHPYIKDFSLNQTGPMTISGCEALAFVDTEEKDYPALELLFISGSLLSDPIFKSSYSISDQLWNKSFRKNLYMHSYSMYPILLRPKSRGRLFLRDKSIYSKPRILANYLENPEDVRTLIKGIKIAIKISKSKSMGLFGSQMYDVPLAGCEKHVFNSDAYWECALRTLTFTLYHYTGTCKMGPKNDSTAVVNSKLQVRS